MDLFLPSPSFSSVSAASPLPSIYDQEKSNLGRFCGISTFSNTSMESDDVCCLDDNMEDGSLGNLLTPDVINTLQQTTAFNSSNELSWTGKLEPVVSVPGVCDSLISNSTFSNLNMGPDVSFVNDIMNMGQSDIRANYSNFGCCKNDLNCFNNHIGLSCVSINSSTPEFVQTSTDNERPLETVTSSNDMGFTKKGSSGVGNTFVQNIGNLKSHFPPRATQPQIGVAAVIKPHLEERVMFLKKENDEPSKLRLQTPNLHTLLSIKSEHTDLKSEAFRSMDCDNKGRCASSEISAQIVPSAGSMKRTHAGLMKSEPGSPKSLSWSKVKDKSTEEMWQDVKTFMGSPENKSSMSKRIRLDSGSSEHISEDDDDDYDDDKSSSFGEKDRDDSDDDFSDIDADLVNLKPSECESLVTLGKKQKQFFWQYNVQSKGPKGTRLKLAVESPADPHVLNNFEDPVFDVCNTAIAGIRHGGKARKGDGNEITPNPKKLYLIGHQLMRLNDQINACQLGTDVPLARRNESRKEKNKLASRACRLKKKAQHEANKIKLYGLEQEHSQLNSVLRFIWPHIRERARAHMRQMEKLRSTSATLTSMLESQISQNLKSMIAGHTVDYVNSVILKVESGDFTGGLTIRRSQKT